MTGTVQGVGFRPFVYRHAVGARPRRVRCATTAPGVLIEVEGEPARASPSSAACSSTTRRRWPASRPVDVRGASPPSGATPGSASSRATPAARPTAPVSVDTATCAACLAEVDDPADRRYRYPFTNCTNCGPRYTIVRSVPYDRPATTMAGFAMCAACQAEYDDPADRRFHAQPNACPACGPRADAGAARGRRRWPSGADAPRRRGRRALRGGRIVAVKGIGGYHLAVDATDDAAVAELRRRKARDDKPFAVMVADLAARRAAVRLDDAAAAGADLAPGRPIVLAPAGAGRRRSRPGSPRACPSSACCCRTRRCTTCCSPASAGRS